MEIHSAMYTRIMLGAVAQESRLANLSALMVKWCFEKNCEVINIMENVITYYDKRIH